MHHDLVCSRLLRLTACLLLTACGGGDGPRVLTPGGGDRSIIAVSIAPTGPVSIAVGDTLRFSASVSQRVAEPRASVRWRVSDAALASVTDDGLLTATAPGTFSLLAIAGLPAAGGFAADTVVATVQLSTLPPSLLALEVQPGILSVPVGSIVQFDPQAIRAAPQVQVTYAYQVLSPIATVDNVGVITTYFPGTSPVRITATGSAPGYQTTTLVAQGTLSVVPTPALSTFEVPAALTVPAGATLRVPMTLVQPRGAAPAAVSVEVSAGGIATVSGEGTDWSIRGDKVGTVTLVIRASAPGTAGFYTMTRTATVAVNVVP